MPIEELAAKVRLPFDSIAELTDEGVMDTAVKMVDEAPFASCVDCLGVEGACGVEADIGVGPSGQCNGVVVQIIDADIKAIAQTVQERRVHADGSRNRIDGPTECTHVLGELDR